MEGQVDQVQGRSGLTKDFLIHYPESCPLNPGTFQAGQAAAQAPWPPQGS